MTRKISSRACARAGRCRLAVRGLALAGLHFIGFAFLGCAGGQQSRPGSGANGANHGVLRFGVQAVTVVDDSNRNRIWVIVDVPHRSLQFERVDTKFASRFNLTLALRNQKSETVQLVDDERQVTVDSYQSTQPESLFVRVAKFMDAPPAGEYILEASVTDEVAKGHGFYNFPINVRDLSGAGLVLSDILLLDEVPRGFPDAEQIVPSFRQRFNQTIYAFAQARNVTVGQRIRASLSVGDPEEARSAQAGIDTVAYTPTVNLFFPIPPTQLGLGRQQLKMHVISNDQTVEATRPLMVRWALRPTSKRALADYIAPMRLIMDSKDWKELKNASPERQRELLTEFWKNRNPTPESKTNLLEEEFYWRVGEANNQFSWGKTEGWETDRGRIYIVHGPPDNVSRRFDQQYGRSLEIWRYENPVREFLFYDEHGDGRFLLIRQTAS
jgi:GWxTD domain-containing protein